MTYTCTHETFVSRVVALVRERCAKDPIFGESDCATIDSLKLVYGRGESGLRGITCFNRWRNGSTEPAPLIEVCAFGQESWVQLAGTVVHELAHACAGLNAGHSKEWKDTCARLGLRNAMAAGHKYHLAGFEPDLRLPLAAMPKPDDGQPVNDFAALGIAVKPRACGAGIGTRGGKSRGTGSGSRLKKVICGDCGYTARVTQKWLDVGAPHCPEHGPMDIAS